MGGKAKGFEDNRDMFPQAVRAVRELQPKAFMFENGRGLLRSAFVDYVEFIRLQLTYPAFPISMMTIKTLTEVYSTASTGLAGDIPGTNFAPYSWSSGEFGMMVTDEAFTECCEALPGEVELSAKSLLQNTMLQPRQVLSGNIVTIQVFKKS